MVKKFIGKDTAEYQRPYIPFYIQILLKQKKGTRSTYRKLVESQTVTIEHPKWEQELDIIIDTKTSKLIYRNCFHTIKDNYLVWLQYKILHRILGTRNYLYKLKISESESCIQCKEEKETILHMYWERPVTMLLLSTTIISTSAY